MEKKGETWYAGMFPEGDLDALEKEDGSLGSCNGAIASLL
jgi:hypothetical protein